MKRRQLIAILGTGATAAVAGCIGDGEATRPNDTTPTPTPTDAPTPTETGTPEGDDAVTWGEFSAERGTDYFGDPSLELVGRLTAHRDFETLWVTVRWYLKDGTRLGSSYDGIDMVEDLRDGDTWEYRVTFWNTEEYTADDVAEWEVFAEW